MSDSIEQLLKESRGETPTLDVSYEKIRTELPKSLTERQHQLLHRWLMFMRVYRLMCAQVYTQYYVIARVVDILALSLFSVATFLSGYELFGHANTILDIVKFILGIVGAVLKIVQSVGRFEATSQQAREVAQDFSATVDMLDVDLTFMNIADGVVAEAQAYVEAVRARFEALKSRVGFIPVRIYRGVISATNVDPAKIYTTDTPRDSST